MSPLQIEIMLHYHTRLGDYRDGDFDAPAVRDAMEDFVTVGLLRRTDNPIPATPIYEATEATHVYVKALCAVPLPVKRWVMP